MLLEAYKNNLTHSHSSGVPGSQMVCPSFGRSDWPRQLPFKWYSAPIGCMSTPLFPCCGLGRYLSVAVSRCYWCFFPEYFHGNGSVLSLILRSVWEWRRMRRNRTLNTVRTPHISIVFEFVLILEGEKKRNNDCRKCRGCGPHGRNAHIEPSLSSSSYRSCHTFCMNRFLRFYFQWINGSCCKFDEFSMKMNETKIYPKFRSKWKHKRLDSSNSRKEGCVSSLIVMWPGYSVLHIKTEGEGTRLFAVCSQWSHNFPHTWNACIIYV